MNTSKQLANTVLMVRPVDFCFNEETAVDNEFQNKLEESNEKINALAMEEFAQMVEKLRAEDVNVLVLEQGENKVKTPDAVFPNNWFSTEHDGTVLLYPMLTLNRRAEKNRFLDVEELLAKNNYFIYSDYTIHNLFYHTPSLRIRATRLRGRRYLSPLLIQPNFLK